MSLRPQLKRNEKTPNTQTLSQRLNMSIATIPPSQFSLKRSKKSVCHIPMAPPNQKQRLFPMRVSHSRALSAPLLLISVFLAGCSKPSVGNGLVDLVAIPPRLQIAPKAGYRLKAKATYADALKWGLINQHRADTCVMQYKDILKITKERDAIQEGKKK